MNKQTDTTDVVVQLVKPDVLVCTTALPVFGASAQAIALYALECRFYGHWLLFQPFQSNLCT